MRLSTRDLFVVLTFAAVIAWCAGQVGYDNELFWLSTIISLILGAIFATFSAARDARLSLVIGSLFLGGFCALPFGSLAVLLVAGLLFLSMLVCVAVPITSFRARSGIAMVCIAGAFTFALTLGTSYVRELAELRKAYPLESLADRLDYESSNVSTSGPIVLQAAVDKRLAGDEQIFDRQKGRQWDLELIHDRTHEKFVRAIGFGVMRMPLPRKESVERPELQDIPFNGLEKELSPSDFYPWSTANPTTASGPADALHDASRFDFLNAEGFGAIRTPRTQVAGFIEHAFHRHPLEGAKARPQWSVDRIELVSLLKHDAPRVYVLDHLPRMDQLNGETAPTRPLNAFEASALVKLRTDEDLVVAQNGAEVQMLGSLRAANQCLDCHNVQRGELLGAFSYRLTEVDAAAPASDDGGELQNAETELSSASSVP